ncbi:MAG TPA: hypothetical protein VMT16_10650 [Thermoanaerobaculia bacterium]|nr:hypothetical protein [Thermoanaerobaculia bacterium]
MRGKLFGRDFLAEGIRETLAWARLGEAEVAATRDRLRAILASFSTGSRPNEAVTEHGLIFPVLEALGWEHILPQQSASPRGRRDVPDALLFADAEAKARAAAEGSEAAGFRHGLAVLESKRWDRPLDRAGTPDEDEGVPSTQMLRYLSRAEVLSERAIQWGILTNGRFWRLYFQGARSRSEEFCEIDLGAALGIAANTQADTSLAEPGGDDLRVFLLLFGRASFLPDPGDPEGRSFLLLARAESRLWEERVSRQLGDVVFEEVFPALARALIDGDPQAPRPLTAEYLQEVRRAALTFLYRILFVLYAEDRNLLPATDRRYDDYSLRAIRHDIATRTDARDAFSATATRYARHLQDLFVAIGKGDSSIGLPAYDGGLFEAGSQPLIDRAGLADARLAPLLDRLSRRPDEAGRRHWINYRDLSVQHLGSVYERLLEFDVVAEANGLEIRPNLFARRGTGSYYTHDDLVTLILERSVGPLIEEARRRFADLAAELASDRRSKEQRLAELAKADPAQAVLSLRICDPAMGSGHFLVSLVDFLADRVLELMAESEATIDWASDARPYASPLAGRLEALRERILAAAEAGSWVLDRDQLDDRHLVRRMVLKRCVHGVDKNPMAVELAKVALWLHTFTVGAPLSFLDHHLRGGDSLFGEWVDAVREELAGAGAMFIQGAIVHLRNASQLMASVSEISDLDLDEVAQSKTFFRDADDALEPLRKLLDLWHAHRWYVAGVRRDHPGLAPLLRGAFGDLLEVLTTGSVVAKSATQGPEAKAVNELLAFARGLADEERFLHWELAFPTVWPEIHRTGGSGRLRRRIGQSALGPHEAAGGGVVRRSASRHRRRATRRRPPPRDPRPGGRGAPAVGGLPDGPRARGCRDGRRPHRRPVPAPGARRRQHLLAVRRAGGTAGAAARHGGAARALRHRLGSRGSRVLPRPRHVGASRGAARLREPAGLLP